MDGLTRSVSIGVVTIQTTHLTVNSGQPDITLVLDFDAVITDVKLSNAIAGETVREWVGRAWSDTVADIGSDKVRRMVSDAREHGVSAFRQVTQRFPSGLELPIEYTTIRMDGQPGLLAVGKSLQAMSELQSRLVAAQHAMEQDYWKLREVETRYRLLFDASNEAVLLLRPDDLKIIKANPAAIRALGVTRGWDFLSEMEPQERAAFQGMLTVVRETGKAPGIVIHLGAQRDPWIVRATLMNTEASAAFMLQLASVGIRQPTDSVTPMGMATLFERLPDSFVVVDRLGTVKRANRAFLDLVEASVDGAVVGKTLQKWLPVAGADLPVLLSQVLSHGAVRMFQTTMRGELGTETAVEISGIGDDDIRPSFVGFIIRDVSRRQPPAGQLERHHALPGLLPHDGVPLRRIVDEVIGIVERDYVLAALDRTDGNRAAAAELLGMSRQSLYAKLNRYGLDGGHKKAS